jgi:serine/threonine protein kinase
MTKSKQKNIDYPTLLGYTNSLGIKVYDMSQIGCQFRPEEIIGQGASMLVYRGHLYDSDISGSDAIPVALKAPLKAIDKKTGDTKVSDILNNVRQEIRMMKHFDGHPNIIKLYGITFKNLNPIMIVELATEGCITDYLEIKKHNGEPIDWGTKAQFCYNVADGIRALHAADIVHGDLKGDNILLFPDPEIKGELVAKITDFGYSTTGASIKEGSGTGGTPNFNAPECTPTAPDEMKKYVNMSTKDNYSFGLFVWQVAKDGEVPFMVLEEEEDIDPDEIKHDDKDLQCLLDTLPGDTPEGFRTIIIGTTKYEPEERVALTKVKEIMGFDTIGHARYFLKISDNTCPNNRRLTPLILLTLH